MLLGYDNKNRLCHKQLIFFQMVLFTMNVARMFYLYMTLV